MSALSNAAEKLLLDWLMTTGTAVRPTQWHLAVFTAAPDDAGGGTELSGDGYSRQALTFAAATSGAGTTSNTVAVSFTADGGDWGACTHVAIFTAATGGTMLWHGAMTTPRTIADADTLNFAIGEVDLAMA